MTALQFTRDIDAHFFTTLDAIAAELGANPREMMAVFFSESGCSATSHNDNPKNLPPEQRWNASGIFQAMPATLRGLGWTQGHAAFRRLNATQQLEWARRYYLPYKGRLATVGGLYVANFLPALLYQAYDRSFVLTAKNGPLGFAYAPNSSFDANHDYAITVGELEDAVARNCRGPRWAELVARLEGGDVEPSPTPKNYDLRTTLGIQQALAVLGYPVGAVDGIPGPHTVAAIAAFQAAAGLVNDGIPGPRTREALQILISTV